MPLTFNNIESELSYAVLHAVAARAGYPCEVRNRHLDDMGIDASVTAKQQFPHPTVFTEVTIDFQLKATSQCLPDANDQFSYSLRKPHYDKLRTTTIAAPRFLALLILPQDESQWLSLSPEQLVCRNCLYWQSLRNAPDIEGASKTIYVPKNQVLDPAALERLAGMCARLEYINYDLQ